MEFRLYNKPNCNLFDLIGSKEPDQTKGLGLIMSESKLAMKAFLRVLQIKLTFPNDITFRKLLNCRWIVDCEHESKSKYYRADIIIRFYKNNAPFYVIAIEAKTINGKVDPWNAATQLSGYVNHLESLKPFKKNISEVILTNTDIPRSAGRQCFVTWMNVINELEKVPQNANSTTFISEYINYLTKLNGHMKHYTHEVMSIPAGTTYELIKEKSIYICTIDGKHYKARAHEKPFFIGCRQKGGKITELYKIKEVIQLNLVNYKGSFISANDVDYLKTIENDLPTRINKWCVDRRSQPFKAGPCYVFVLEQSFFKLPNNGIIDKGKGGKGARNHTFPKLSAIFEKSMLSSSQNTLSENDYD